MPIDKRAVTNWERAQHAYQHYQNFIVSKPNRYSLSFADLVFVKNFKGGNALLAEPVTTFNTKIAYYEKILKICAADSAFNNPLSKIPVCDYPRIKKLIIDFVSLPNSQISAINGFGCSFASALLHFYFPSVVPILDKRALNGSSIQGIQVNKYNNVTNLLSLYPNLIDYCRTNLEQRPYLTMRQLDKELFIQQLNIPPFH